MGLTLEGLKFSLMEIGVDAEDNTGVPLPDTLKVEALAALVLPLLERRGRRKKPGNARGIPPWLLRFEEGANGPVEPSEEREAVDIFVVMLKSFFRK
mmetsp:Transcript_30251/g.69337  ORF Transcript_30251/g.69337 Transcript_30251/m.69337 type:complete len:97 (+) Transcript_30251:1088-1378(+)